MSSINLHIGLADFAEPTLLILGNEASLNWLADQIESRQAIDLATASCVNLRNVSLLLKPTENGGSFNRKGAKFIWKISSSESQQFSDQLRALAASKVPAHAYLDSIANRAGVEVIASMGEYTTDVVSVP